MHRVARSGEGCSSCPCYIILRPRRLVVRNAFSRNGFVFDRNFFEILKNFRSRTPEDLVLEWFRRHNVPDGQVKVGIHRSEVQQQAHLRSRQRFFGVCGAFKVAPGFEFWVFGRSWGHHSSGCLRDFAPGRLFSIEISRNAKRREGSVFESQFEKLRVRNTCP